MEYLFSPWIRANIVGVTVLLVALIAQWALNSRVPASWRVWLWRVAMLQTALALIPLAPIRLALLMPPIKASPLPSTIESTSSVAFPPSPQNTTISSPKFEKPLLATIPSEPLPTPVAQTTKDVEKSSLQFPRWPLLLAFIYLLGVGAHLVCLVRSAVILRRQLSQCSPVEDSALIARLQETAAILGLKRLPRLLQCESGAPFSVGIWRTCIVVPCSYLEGSPSQMEAVLAHELAHCVRRDLAWNAILCLISTVFWFHPLVWLARRFHALEVESACDELVLQTTSITPKSYGQLLLNAMNFHHSPLTVGVGDGFFALKTRLSRLNHAGSASPKAYGAFAVALLLSFGVLIPWRLVARAQNVIPRSAPTRVITGTVHDQRGKPVAGATVYSFTKYTPTGGYPYKITMSDARGIFRFAPIPSSENEVTIFADAGQRGMGQMSGHFLSNYETLRRRKPIVRIIPGVIPRLRFLNPQNRPAAGLNIGLAIVSPVPGNNIIANHLTMPRPVFERFKGRTDANGEVVFPPLPRNGVAQFYVRRNGAVNSDFAQLSEDGTVRLNSDHPTKTIRLATPLKLRGRVVMGENKVPAAGSLIYVRRVAPADEVSGERDIRFLNGAVANARGEYEIRNLRPGRYWVWSKGRQWWKDGQVGTPLQIRLTKSQTIVDLPLAQGPIVQGTLISQRTKQPVKSQRVTLYDSQGESQNKATNARGQFQFRTLVGKHRLEVGENFMWPSNGLALPANPNTLFSIKEGQTRNFKIELPDKKAAKNR